MRRTKQYDIDARNMLNVMADQVEPALIAIMAAFIGKKVWKVSGYGGLTVAAKKAVDDTAAAFGLTHEAGWRLVIGSTGSRILAELAYRYAISQEACDYTIETFSIGRHDDFGILIESEDCLSYPAGRPQFTVAEVETTLNRAYELESQARDLRRSVACFTR